MLEVEAQPAMFIKCFLSFALLWPHAPYIHGYYKEHVQIDFFTFGNTFLHSEYGDDRSSICITNVQKVL